MDGDDDFSDLRGAGDSTLSGAPPPAYSEHDQFPQGPGVRENGVGEGEHLGPPPPYTSPDGAVITTEPLPNGVHREGVTTQPRRQYQTTNTGYTNTSGAWVNSTTGHDLNTCCECADDGCTWCLCCSCNDCCNCGDFCQDFSKCQCCGCNWCGCCSGDCCGDGDSGDCCGDCGDCDCDCGGCDCGGCDCSF